MAQQEILPSLGSRLPGEETSERVLLGGWCDPWCPPRARSTWVLWSPYSKPGLGLIYLDFVKSRLVISYPFVKLAQTAQPSVSFAKIIVRMASGPPLGLSSKVEHPWGQCGSNNSNPKRVILEKGKKSSCPHYADVYFLFLILEGMVCNFVQCLSLLTLP